MEPSVAPELRIRRARWRDFSAVAALVAQCGAGELPPERRTIRRFRHIVHDLGNDLYLAFLAEDLVGLLHVVYLRELVRPRRAEISALLVSPAGASSGVAQALLTLAWKRAQKRDCGTLVFRAAGPDDALLPLLIASGFRSAGPWYMATVPQGQADSSEGEG